MQFHHIAIGHVEPVDHRGCCGDQVEIELALEPLLDDFQVQEPEKAAAETKTERCGCFHFERERGIVEPELAHGGAKFFEICGIDREQATEHHRLRRFEAGQGFRRRPLVFGDGVADAGVGHFLD